MSYNLSGILLIVIVLCWAYYPGTKLFWRNEDWELMSAVGVRLRSFKGIIEFISGTQHDLCKHFYPLGNAIVFVVFKICGNKYKFHYLTLLLFHIINVVLINFVCIKITSNYMAGLYCSIFFGFSSFVPDLISRPCTLFHLMSVSAILTSMLTHPALIEASTTTNIIFYISLFAAPLIYEGGLFASIIAISVFFLNKQLELPMFLVLTLPIVTYFVGRKMVNGAFGMYNKEQGNKSAYIAFVGIRQMVINISVGTLKIVMDFFSAKFNIKIYDLMYVLNIKFKNYKSILASFAAAYLLYLVSCFVINREVLTVTKYYYVVLFVCCCGYYLMMSFNIEPWMEKKSDPERQSSTTPHLLYHLSALMVIPVAHILAGSNAGSVLFLFISIYVAVTGLFSIREVINLMLPHTNKIKEGLSFYEKFGYLPYKGRRYCSNDFRFDANFTDNYVDGYFKINDGNYQNSSVGQLGINETYLPILYSIDLVWVFYKLAEVYSQPENETSRQRKTDSLKLEIKKIVEESVLLERHVTNKEIESISFSDCKDKIVATIIRKFINVLRDRGVRFNDEDFSDTELIKFCTPDYIETNILIPYIKSVFVHIPVDDKNISQDKIVKHFSEIDEECGKYVSLLLQKNKLLLSELVGKTIIIWGVGKFSVKIRKIFINVTIETFIDSDPLKQGTFIDGIPVKAPSYLTNCNKPILICNQYTAEIFDHIKGHYPNAAPYVLTVPYPLLDKSK